MKSRKYGQVGLSALLWVMAIWTAWGQVSETNLFPGVNLLVPDGSLLGTNDVRTITSPIVQLTDVRVRLTLAGDYNGDMYAYLRHTTSVGISHLAVLLNRVGRTTTTGLGSYGYSDDGFNVVLSDAAANDVHTYRLVLTPAPGTPLTGLWQTDARFADPELVTTASPRLAFLSLFNGMPAAGEWTLFLADVDRGATNMLVGWGLDLTGRAVPPVTWPAPADILYGTALGPTQLNAASPVPGTYTYNPPAGTVLPVGNHQTLSVTFVPDDANSYVQTTTNVLLTVIPVFALSGTVRYAPTDYPPSNLSVKKVAGVTMNLTGDTNGSAVTLSDGSFGLPGIAAGGNYELTAVKTSDSPTANGVDSFDQFLIQRHILGRTLFDSPYKRLAADVDGSGSIDSFDQFLIQRLILGRASQFPLGLWRFVPADYVFPDANNPWGAPTNRSYANLVADVSGQDFVAIKLGDVDNSWTVPFGGASLVHKSTVAEGSLPGSVPPEVVFHVDRLAAKPGERVTARVLVSGFQQVTSAQFTLVWDPAVLRYVAVGDYGLRGLAAGSFGSTLVDAGKLTLAWYDPQVLGVTVADGTTMFSVSFEALGQAGSVSALALGDSPTLRKASVSLAAAAFGTQGGEIRVVEPGGLRVGDAAFRDGTFQLSVPTVTGQSYVLEFTEGLPATNWTALPAIKGDGTIMNLVDPAATNHQRFYRVRPE